MTPQSRRTIEFVLDNLVWFMLLFVLAVFSLFVPNYFQPSIFANIIEASSVLGVMSIGLALVILAGQMDLSVESVAALSPPWVSAFSSVRQALALVCRSRQPGLPFPFRLALP